MVITMMEVGSLWPSNENVSRKNHPRGYLEDKSKHDRTPMPDTNKHDHSIPDMKNKYCDAFSIAKEKN